MELHCSLDTHTVKYTTLTGDLLEPRPFEAVSVAPTDVWSLQ